MKFMKKVDLLIYTGLSMCLAVVLIFFLLSLRRPTIPRVSKEDFIEVDKKTEDTIQLAVDEQDAKICESLVRFFGDADFEIAKGKGRRFPQADCYIGYATSMNDESICPFAGDSIDAPKNFWNQNFRRIFLYIPEEWSRFKEQTCYSSVAVENNRSEVCGEVKKLESNSTSIGNVNYNNSWYQTCLNDVAIHAEDPLLCGPELELQKYNPEINLEETIKTSSRKNCIVSATTKRTRAAIDQNDITLCDTLPVSIEYEDNGEVMNYTSQANCVNHYKMEISP